MAIWECKVVCGNGSRQWSNVYHIDIGADTDIDPSLLSEIATFYQTNMLTTAFLERIIRRPADTADAFIESSYALAGARSLSGSYMLPVFNTVLMLLTSGAGRPGRKYLRGFLLASDIVDSAGGVASAILTTLNTSFDDVLNAASTASQSFVEGVGDSPIVSTEFPPRVQMRQQHRKRRNPA